MALTALLDYLRSIGGEKLRGVVEYSPDGNSVLFLREDVDTRRFHADLERWLARVRPESHHAEAEAFSVGPLYASVRSFEDATIMHFPRGSERGIVVWLEPSAAQSLNTFVDNCIKWLER